MNKLNIFSKSPKFSNKRTFLQNEMLLEKSEIPIASPRKNEGPWYKLMTSKLKGMPCVTRVLHAPHPRIVLKVTFHLLLFYRVSLIGISGCCYSSVWPSSLFIRLTWFSSLAPTLCCSIMSSASTPSFVSAMVTHVIPILILKSSFCKAPHLHDSRVPGPIVPWS